jgi:hypothetical protein
MGADEARHEIPGQGGAVGLGADRIVIPLKERKLDAVMDPSGKAIFAATSKRSGADGSIVSGIGMPTLPLDITNNPIVNRSRQLHRSSEGSVGFAQNQATHFILAIRPTLEMNLRDRSLS